MFIALLFVALTSIHSVLTTNYRLVSFPSTTNTGSTSVPLNSSPATPPPPPGLPSPAPAHSTPRGYNNGQPWAYTTGQDGVLFPSSGIGGPTNQLHFSNQRSVQYHSGVWNVPQTPRPPNQPWPRGVTHVAQRSPYSGDGMAPPNQPWPRHRGVTPHVAQRSPYSGMASPNQPWPRGVTPHVSQRSPYSGDGMVNHGEGGPRPAGVGTFNGGNSATGMNLSQAVSGSGSGHDIAVTAQPHSSTHQTSIVTWLN